jgi:Na+/H+ antiporter NhaC
MDPHPYGWLSLAPPLAAITLAIVTRRVLLSLFLGILLGALITCHGDPLRAIAQTLEIQLWKTIIHEDKLRLFAFSMLMGAMIGVISASGGMRGLIEAVAPLARNRRRGQLTAWLLGLLVFFDDYASTLLLGNTLRPLCDRLRISRDKLAYIVDSTAAPVAGLALISTWVAGEIGYVQEGLNNLPGGEDLSAVSVFIATIPYRFYMLWALVFVGLVAWTRRDFGPMLAAERRAAAGEGQLDENAPQAHAGPPARWINAVLPIGVTVVGITWLMYSTGRANVGENEGDAFRRTMNIFGEADAYFALMWGSLAGLLTAVGLALAQRLLSARAVALAADAGARLMFPSLAILWLALALSAQTGAAPYPGDDAAYPAQGESSNAYPLPYRLYTGQFLSGVVGDRLSAPLLPTGVFLLAAFISFATGTSWGTMGILMPLVVPLSYGVLTAGGAELSPDDPLFLSSVGGVLAGSIFGDHCSPISDTTILSSQSSGCDHLAHVVTQLPYAVAVAVVTVVCGTLPVGYGVSVWPMLGLGSVILAAMLYAVGRRSPE